MIQRNPLTGKECLKLLDQAARHVDRAEHYWIEQQNLASAKAELGNFWGIKTAIQEFGPKGGDFWKVVIALQHRVNALWKRLMHAEREGYGKAGVRHLPFPPLEGPPPEDPADWWKKNGGKMIATQNRSGMQTEIVRAFLAGRKKSLGTGVALSGGYGTRYKTDGKNLLVWGNLVAERRRGAVLITDAGWLTLLTRNVLNEVIEQFGSPTRIYSKRGKWRIWNYETKKEVDWTGSAVVKGGKVKLLPEARRHGIVFGGYERRRRWTPPPPPPPPKPGLAGQRTLFNPKSRGYTIEKFDATTVRILGRGTQMDGVDKTLRRAGLKVVTVYKSGLWTIIAHETTLDKVKQALGGYKTLFNPKVRLNLHLPVERAQASKLFRRVYGIAYRAIQQRRWNLAAVKYGVMWGLWHAAAIERPPLMRLVRSWYTAIKEIERVAKAAGAPNFWTVRK